MAVLGASPALTYVPVSSQAFSGNGSQTIFTLNTSVGANTDIEVLVDNVQQSPYDGSYTAGGTTLTFSEAPASGTNNVYVVYRAVRITATTQVIPDNGSVTNAKLADESVTNAKLADGSVTSSKLSGDLTTPGNLSVTGTAEILGGSLKLGSELKTAWGKSVKQVVTNSVGSIVINTSTPTAIVSVTITVSAGSTVLVMAQGEQNGEVGDAWQWHQLYRGETALGTTGITVVHASWNSEFNYSFWDTNLAAGTYTYSMRAWNGLNYCSYGEHSDPIIQVVEFGV